MLIFCLKHADVFKKYADVFLIRRYTLVINYLQEAVYRRKEKYKVDIL